MAKITPPDDNFSIDIKTKTITFSSTTINAGGATITQLYDYIKDLSRIEAQYAEQKKLKEEMIEKLRNL